MLGEPAFWIALVRELPEADDACAGCKPLDVVQHEAAARFGLFRPIHRAA